ncbi:Pentapeptide superfamily domain containing protein [Pandoravirus celtis]|uniref:Pentapeptide superfamily domain containing protein n=1 Tax=Pandoravirus celtis TaxID=2568002 RepID=A0A4D6EHV3_9VIRU|nr:Pentapeptide superfamily domain containing protein [Pandoravirus celtis]
MERKRTNRIFWRLPCRKRQRRQRDARTHGPLPSSVADARANNRRNDDESGGRGNTRVPSVTHMPDELIERVLGLLSGRDLAAAACTCRAVARVADCERLWKAVYRRDICAAGPPIEHIDHEAHGKSTRWLYGLMAAPVGRVRLGPTGRLTARLAGPDGVVTRSGEFVVVVAEKADCAEFVLDGYGAKRQFYDSAYIHEGQFVRGVLGGVGRSALMHKAINGGGVHMTSRGPFVGGLPHGLMRVEYDTGTVEFVEYVQNKANGRFFRVEPDGSADAGSVVTPDTHCDRPGVERLPSGMLRDYIANGRGEPMALIERYNRALPRTDEPTMRCASKHKDGTYIIHWTRRQMPGATAACVCLSARGVVRANYKGDVVVADVDGLCFLAIGHTHPDPRLAGRHWIARAMKRAPRGAAGDVLDSLSPSSTHTREETTEVRVCRFAARLNQATADTLVPLLEGALLKPTHAFCATGADQRDRTNLDDNNPCDHDDASPFGVVVTGDDATGDDARRMTDSEARPYVHCFLAGARVLADKCALFASGRFYRADLLRDWLAFAPCDPETGDAVAPNIAPIAWRPWMQHAPPAILNWAMRDLSTWLTLAGKSTVLSDHAIADLLRAAVIGALGTPMRPGLDVLTTAATCLWKHKQCDDGNDNDNDGDAADVDDGTKANIASDDSDDPCHSTLTPGFDHITLDHLELRHPQWDPRGPWTFGPPAVPIEDPTMGDHERDPDGPPDRFVQSHDILRVALDGPVSFVGARLRNVFFFGQAFRGASFAAASLDRCAFVGCTFDDDCVFARAVLTDCGFYACRDARDQTVNVSVIKTAFHAVVS